MDNSDWRVEVADCDVEISPGSSAFLSLFDSRDDSSVLIVDSSDWRVCVADWDVEIGPASSVFLARFD